MARRLDEFPALRAAPSTYPWDEWFDGAPWLLRKGEDYKIGSASMRAAVSRAAKQKGKRARTRVVKDDDGTEALAIQAH